MGTSRSKTKKTAKRYHIKLSRLSILLWGGCLFFVLSWIFVLGILVGRGYLPGAVTVLSDLRDEVNTLQEMVSRDRSHRLTPSKGPESDPELRYHDSLTATRHEAKERWGPKRPVKGPGESQRQGQVLPPKENTTRMQVVVSQTTQPNPSASRIADAQYTIQLASFGEKDRAEKMVNDLAGRGMPAYLHEGRVKGKTYYRVRCGIFPRKEAAQDYAERLSKEQGIKGLVIRSELSHD